MTHLWHRTLCSIVLALGLIAPSAAQDDDSRAASQPFLGVRPARSDAGQTFDDTTGILIDHIVLGSTADSAGLQPGDRLVRIDDHVIDSNTSLQRVVRSIAVGTDITLIILRSGEEQRLNTTMQGYPSARIWDEAIQTEQQRRSEQLQEIRDITQALTENRWRNHALAGTMNMVAMALESLPPRIATAAAEFDKVYPDGRFDISFTIRIASHRDQDDSAAKTSEAESDPDVSAPGEENSIPHEDDSDAAPGDRTDEPDTAPDSDRSTAPLRPSDLGSRAVPRRHPRLRHPIRDRESGPDADHQLGADAARSGTPALLAAMASLASALEELPVTLQEAANSFHSIYPEGIFQVSVQVHIIPDPNDEHVLRLGPKPTSDETSQEPDQESSEDNALDIIDESPEDSEE